MPLAHLGLPVTDVDRSRRFYEAYFGFDPSTAQRAPRGGLLGAALKRGLHRTLA